MEIFNLTLSQMLMMFLLMALGFILRKCKILPENSDTTISRMETYIFVPALSMYTQMTKCTVETFRENSALILYGLIIIVCAILIAKPLSRLFIPKASLSPERSYQRNIYSYALTFGNFGFMGNFIILGVWGEDMFYKYTLFTFLISVACYSWGLYVLVPKDQNDSLLQSLKKGLLKPPMIALVAGMIIGLTGLTRYVPDFVMSALDNSGVCQGPVAMVLAGFVIGGYNFKSLICDKKVYMASAMRLIVLPALLMVIMKFLGCSVELMTLALICFATPLGLNTIVYPAAYGGDTRTGASMTMVSHVLSVVTIPLMYLVFIAA